MIYIPPIAAGAAYAALPAVNFRAATDLDQEIILGIRNSARDFMTGNKSWLTLEHQRKWWIQKESFGYRLWVVEMNGEIVGFGMLQNAQDREWATLALMPSQRNKGIGTRLYRFLCEQAKPLPTYIKVLASNVRSRKAAIKAGFELVDQSDGILTMKCV